MAKVDADGLEDFESEETETGSDTSLDFDPNEDVDGYDGDDIDFKSILKGEDLDEDDYEDEDEDTSTDSGGEAETEEDGSTSAQDDSFKNEENARNAERRRQEEAARAEQIRQQSPEYQLIQQMSQMTGQTPEQMMAKLQEEQLKAQAVQHGVPLEMYRMMHQATETAKAAEARAQQLEFENWNSRVDQDMTRLQNELPMLDQNDLIQAKSYILQTLKNTNVSLEEATYALHGRKIAEGLRDSARTETLAEVSGRKKSSGLPLSTKPASQPEGLTDAERAMARMLGMSAKDYAKYK